MSSKPNLKTTSDTTKEQTGPETLQALALHPENMSSVAKTYLCKHCKRAFLSHRQLGGHVSKAHPEPDKTPKVFKPIKKEKKKKSKYPPLHLSQRPNLKFQTPPRMLSSRCCNSDRC